MLNSLADWVCSAVVPRWVYKSFHMEAPGQEKSPQVAGENARLFLFMHDLRERRRRLGRLLGKGLVAEEGDQPWLGGCYLAGTGADATLEQGFVAGIFRRLAQEEETGVVSWTPEALEEDAACQGRITLIRVALVVLAVAILGLGTAVFWAVGAR
jgi:hypothetical protein